MTIQCVEQRPIEHFLPHWTIDGLSCFDDPDPEQRYAGKRPVWDISKIPRAKRPDRAHQWSKRPMYKRGYARLTMRLWREKNRKINKHQRDLFTNELWCLETDRLWHRKYLATTP